jgi:hypothetical protein
MLTNGAFTRGRRSFGLAVFLLSAQEDRVARERAAGLDTALSAELLFTMQAILRSFLVHRQAIFDALDDQRWSPCAGADSGRR